MAENTTENQPNDNKQPRETEPLLPQQSTSNPTTDRPRTVRHHRRALSGRSTRSHLSGQISFGPNPNDPSAHQIKHEADGRARSRFLKALLVGIGLWLFIGFVFGWAGLHRAGWGQTGNRVDYGAKPTVPSTDGRAVWCAKFETPRLISSQEEGPNNNNNRMPGETLKSKVVFSIPLSQLDTFFIHGKGKFAKGQVSISATSNSLDQAQIEVVALTNDEALVDLMTVCHVDQLPSQSTLLSNQSPATSLRNIGLGIYTPTPELGPYPDSDLEFRVKVNLPKGLTSIPKLSVKGDLFAVTATGLSGFPFDKVEMVTTTGPIKIDELVSDQVIIRTSNGHIEGSFKVGRTLNLATTNGAIIANVALSLPNTNPIDHSEQLTKPVVTVDIASMNGAVSVHYVEQAIGTSLFSSVKSTNGRAHVEHGPEYEGEFEVETTWGSADVKGPNKSSKDPTGNNRLRQKFIKTNRDELGFRHISGIVWWGDKNDDKESKSQLGFTRVKTTLGSARATFF